MLLQRLLLNRLQPFIRTFCTDALKPLSTTPTKILEKNIHVDYQFQQTCCMNGCRNCDFGLEIEHKIYEDLTAKPTKKFLTISPIAPKS